MARPTKPGDDRRTAIVRARFTVAEKQRLETLAKNAGLTVSDWLRVCSLGTEPEQRKPTPERETLLRILAELGKQGSNVNQIARALNRKDDSDGETHLPRTLIAHALESIAALTTRIRTELQHGHQRSDTR